MALALSMIGFGEAAAAFADGAGWDARAFDVVNRTVAMSRCRVITADTGQAAVVGAKIVLNLVTPSAALVAAQAAAPDLAPGALWLDMTSVAPATKRAAAAEIAAAGGRYVDAAIMAPVLPARRGVPVRLAGPDTAAGFDVLTAAGFTDVAVVAGPVGTAAAIKMIRSVMIKGIEALTAECLAAADRAGVVDPVLASLGPDWTARADYNLDRMLVHGARRADEMAEVMATLTDLGVDPAMSRATAGWQRRLGVGTAPDGLAAKLARLAERDPASDRHPGVDTKATAA